MMMRLAGLMQAVSSDWVALVPGTNMRYFTGLDFHLSERPIIALANGQAMHWIIPALEEARLADLPAELTVTASVWTDETGYAGAFRDAVAHLAGARVGLDGQTMRAFEWFALQQAGLAQANIADVAGDLLGFRAVKSPDEINAMRAAVALSERALGETLTRIRPGMREREIADVLADQLTQQGSTGLAFNPIVLTGPNSALPHGVPGDRAWGPGELLLIDFGGKAGEYPADITRTFAAGQPDARLLAAAEAVLAANRAAFAAAAPGVAAGEVDAAARRVIDAAGLGACFMHRTGHGLGLDVHELPQIAPENPALLVPGNVFTIEPGVYLPGLGGVRIEDNVFITETGAESLTEYPRALAIL
jgi:Xaa-Pro dipeptidase